MEDVSKKMGTFVLASACMGLCFTAAPAAAYNVYYGHLHNHSNVSDGTGTPASAYSYARYTAGLDFFSLADHAEQISSTEWTTIKNAANSANSDGNFVALWGFEWSHGTYGHVAVINTTDYCASDESATNTFSELVTWVENNDGLAFFNHPGRQDTGYEFDHFSSSLASDSFVGMELWNKSDDFDDYYYTSGYYSGDSMGHFDEALTRGWYIGASGSGDNHSGTWGTANDFRMGVLASSLTRANILEAIDARRFFSTLDKNIELSFTIDGEEMGSVMDAGTYDLRIEADDANTEDFSKIELYKNGAVEDTWYPNDDNPIITDTITTSDGDYFYIKVTQDDGDEAISSPIFMTGESQGSGSGSISKRIATGDDDVEQYQTGGTMYMNSSDLELVYDGSKGNQYVGLRFTGLNIPQGATITSASIQFTVDETNTGTTNLTIKAEDTDDAAAFTTSSYNVSNRTTTSEYVSWSPASWTSVGAAGADQKTPDLSDVVQEVVDRTGWSSGNDMVFIITGTGERTAESYNGSSSNAALLEITYTE
ncbi:MAG: CehA/McbA family metallohydrolase [Candidatus Electrothrix aestuarii]|uniref:CehA/McbA family metallohydrolase n=1 Tax=Candidatus Electrothrix aestuarii TaxID=3062594 RepID=A0AAU8LSD1_9BACT